MGERGSHLSHQGLVGLLRVVGIAEHRPRLLRGKGVQKGPEGTKNSFLEGLKNTLIFEWILMVFGSIWGQFFNEFSCFFSLPFRDCFLIIFYCFNEIFS